MQFTAEQRACLQLSLSDGIGPVRMNKGLEKYQTYASALSAVQASKLKTISAATEQTVEKVLEECAKNNIDLLFIGSPDYPAALKNIPDAPHVLYLKGNINLLQSECISIVGTRNASINSLKFTEKLASYIGKEGYCTVSGLARGIDAAAHKGALTTKGRTIAVLAGGLGKIYPPEHTKLAEDIVTNDGLLISEMPPYTEHIAPLFPRRNRIVSGLSQTLCVTECTIKSGSLITAKLALEQGRDVFAVPGHPTDPRSAGPNHLLQQGAYWLEKPSDALYFHKQEPQKTAQEEMELFTGSKQSSQLGETQVPLTLEGQILELLTNTPTLIGELCEQTGADFINVSTAIAMLELQGEVTRHGPNSVMKVTS